MQAFPSPPTALPERRHVYQNHHIDSTRWDYFVPRPDDIVIATSYKAGTTWMQSIVANLLFGGSDFPAPVGELSPWLDMRLVPLELVLKQLEAQTHRRFIKTHLPLDGVPYRADTRYLYVGRDARDVFMSLWNHYTRHTGDTWLRFNLTLGRVGDEFPPPPDDIHTFWRDWMTRGWFPWESDGFPYWSHLYNVQSWWDFRELPNLLLVHYADLLRDLPGELRRIADFLGLEADDALLARVAENVSFAAMKRDGAKYAPGGGAFWEGGADTFLFKGTNGRWREVLADDELALYDAACGRTLTPACRRWLEDGGPA